MKPKQRRYAPKPKPQVNTHVPYALLLNPEALYLVQASFRSMEEVLRRNVAAPGWRLALAAETFSQVKQKVSKMLLAPGEAVEFDYNELLIIRTCLQLYTIDLLYETNAGAERVGRAVLPGGEFAAARPSNAAATLRLTRLLLSVPSRKRTPGNCSGVRLF